MARSHDARLPSPAEALPGRPDPMPVPERHFVSGRLAKNPEGYRGLGGTGVSCPIGTGVASGAGRLA